MAFLPIDRGFESWTSKPFFYFFSQKRDKRWRNMWQWKPVQNIRVELQIFDFSTNVFVCFFERIEKKYFCFRNLLTFRRLQKLGKISQILEASSNKTEGFIPIFGLSQNLWNLTTYIINDYFMLGSKSKNYKA